LQLITEENIPALLDDDHRRLFRRLRDLDMHAHVLVDSGKLEAVLDQLGATGVKLVVDHFGALGSGIEDVTGQIDMIARAAEKARLWVKLSSGFRFDDPERPKALAGLLVKRLGADRLFWGSDAPFVGHEHGMSYDRALAWFREWLPDAKDRAAVAAASLNFYFPELA
jgi:predicted TIM-barrel fold metal-dependent hydrolase